MSVNFKMIAKTFYGFENILRYDFSKIEEDTDLSNSGGIVKWTYNANPKWNIKFSYANTTYSSKHYSKLYDISSPIDELAQSIQERNTFNDESINIYQNIRIIKMPSNSSITICFESFELVNFEK